MLDVAHSPAGLALVRSRALRVGNRLFIQQLPDLVNQLGLLYHTIESRVKMFHKLTKLHGKLYLLMCQVGFTVSHFRSLDLVLFFPDDQPLA